MRAYYTLRHLLRFHKVTVYTVGSAPKLNGQSHHPELENLQLKIFPMRKIAYGWNSAAGLFSDLPFQVALYRCPSLAQALNADILRGEFDLLFVHLIRMAEYARPYSNLPRILDMADSISLHYVRMPKVWGSPRWIGARMDQNRVRTYEAEVPKWFDNVLIHTEEDLEWVQKQSRASNLTQSLMGVDSNEFNFQEGPYEPHRIVYCAKLDYLPNTDAAAYFANQIFPLVRRQVPDAQFKVVGFNPPRALRALAKLPGIEVRANVPDVRPEISSAAVSVAPIRFGAGIQNKILQSLAMGVPVVATPLVAKPFGHNGGSPLVVAETPREFASSVARILLDTEYRRQLARKGRELIETRFEWDKVFAPLDRILEDYSNARMELSPGSRTA